MGSITFISLTTKEHLEITASLASEIWREHYTKIIGEAQVQYMLDKFQSVSAIKKQVEEAAQYYLIKEEEDFIGYLAILPRHDYLFLSKIYIKKSRRGLGYGKRCMHFIENMAKGKDFRKIRLTVNKNNKDSIRIYEWLGFHITGAPLRDIGNGFVMDDYQMEKTL